MGIAAFVMAEFLQVPYAEVALAATIPAILSYVALFIQVDLQAARSRILPLPELAQIPKVREVPEIRLALSDPFAVLIYALFWGGEEADRRACWRSPPRSRWRSSFRSRASASASGTCYEMPRDTGLGALDLFMIGAASGIMIGCAQLFWHRLHPQPGPDPPRRRQPDPGLLIIRRSPTLSSVPACRPSAATSCSHRWSRRR